MATLWTKTMTQTPEISLKDNIAKMRIAEPEVHAIVAAELAVLRGGSTGISVFLESTLSRKIIYRHIIDAHFRGVDTGVSDLLELTGQSRQNVAFQIKEMKSMGLMTLKPCTDRRRRCVVPTEKLLEYWREYCLTLNDAPKNGGASY